MAEARLGCAGLHLVSEADVLAGDGDLVAGHPPVNRVCEDRRDGRGERGEGARE